MSTSDSYRDGMRLLSEGHVLAACDHFQSALAGAANELALRYGLLLARSRATPGATLARELDAVLEGTASDPEWHWRFLSLKARLLKAEGESRPAALAEAARLYLRAYELSGDVYPGVNAATLLLLTAQDEAARDLARRIEAQLDPDSRSYWDAATRGEVAVVLEQPDAAIAAYADADRLSRGNHGDRASSRRQLRMLGARRPALVERILQHCFVKPHVIVFSGHRIDSDATRPGRFPLAALDHVQACLREFAAERPDCVCFSSAASGGDILFAEAMLAHGAKINIVLPFPAEQFVHSSVVSDGGDWLARFERVLAGATRVIVANHAVKGAPDVLYHYANLLCDGLAHLHADSIDGQLEHCALLSRSAADALPGGTRHEYQRWRARSYAVHLIEPVPEPGAPVEPVCLEEELPAPGGLSIRAMVFADLVGSSKLEAEELPALLMFFLAEANRFLAEDHLVPWLRNTWGDGLFLVFDTVEQAARFAVRLVNGVRWSEHGGAQQPAIRVSLHAGPVVEAHDAILERNNVFGHHVIRAARVEPVTPPGVVFATEEAASLLRATSDRRFDCVYMGRISMPKGFGETPIYRIDLA